MKKNIIFTFLIAISLIISGCGSKCPSCPEPTAWSSCNDNAIKLRTVYTCSKDTNNECQAFEETLNCKTEITSKGVVGNSLMVISPTIEKNVKGIINIELRNAPEKTTAVAFTIEGGNMEIKEGQGPNLPFDTDKSDGWSLMLDTNKYENGLYTIGAIAGESFSENKPPLDAASIQIIINN